MAPIAAALKLPPCAKCKALRGDPCRTPAWRTRMPHAGRVAATPDVPDCYLTSDTKQPYNRDMTNTIEQTLRNATDRHAALCKAKAPIAQVLGALREVFVATLALAVDSGEGEDEVLFAIEDLDAEIARA